MELRQYAKRLERLSKSYHRMVCMYCGAETTAQSDLCICSNCESITRYDKALLSSRDPTLVESLGVISVALGKKDYTAAIAEYEKIFQERKDPLYLYAESLAYIKYSNDENGNIGYEKPGFMEDNTALREQALGLASEAKRLLAKSAYMLADYVSKGDASLSNLYSLALVRLKLGDLKGAQESVNSIGKLGNSTLYNYAAMLLETQLGNYAQAGKHADALISSDDAPVNAFFYAGLSMFKQGRYADAKRLLDSLSGVSGSASIPALVKEMRESELI